MVDDEEALLENFSRVLGNNGYDVDSAVTGKEATEMLKAKNFDVVLFERQLPDMDGAELFERMCCISPSTVKIILTGWAFREEEGGAFVSGLDAYLTKPVEIQHLLRVIDGAVEGRINKIVRTRCSERKRGKTLLNAL